MDPKTPYMVTPDGDVTPFPPANGKTFTLKELQAAVGGYIEVYPMPAKRGQPKRIVVMDEEGRLKGLPKNALVSQAFGLDALIVGTVIVCPSRMVR